MNVFDYFFENCEAWEKPFLVGSKTSVSYKTIYENALKLASYISREFGQDKNIPILSPNSEFFITAYLAILKSGNVCVPLNPATEAENLTYILNLTESTQIFVTGRLKSQLNEDKTLTLLDEASLEDICKSEEIGEFKPDFDRDRVAEIIFTSGSTGEPKGVMISHGNVIANTDSIIEYLKLTADDRMLVVLPFYYCYGLSLLHTHLRIRGSIVLNNNFIFLGSVINDLINMKCTGFAGVPSHFQILLKKSASFKKTHFEHLRYVTQAGGKLHSVFIDEFITALPEIAFFVMYGQTEATARLAYLPPKDLKEKLSSIGIPIPGVELKVVDEQGRTLGAEKEGELIARGGNIMKGYFRDDAATSNTLKNGWLYTGDIAKKDKEGYFYITARKKEIIKVGGKRVSPKEIEEVILSLPEIIDCTVSSVEDPLLGEAIRATIVLNIGADQAVMKDKIIHHCSKQLALYKIPGTIEFQQSMELSATGKKLKK